MAMNDNVLSGVRDISGCAFASIIRDPAFFRDDVLCTPTFAL